MTVAPRRRDLLTLGVFLVMLAGFARPAAAADNTPPTGTVTINNGAATTNSPTVLLTLVAQDNPGGSGMVGGKAGMQIRNDNPKKWPAGGWESFKTTRSWTLVSGEAIKTVYVKYRDKAGNAMASPATATIRLDSTPPTTPVVSDDGDWIASTTTLHATWAASDPESGIAEYQYAIGTDPWGGSTSVVGWTSAGPATSVTRTGLSLARYGTYFVSVKAKNGAGTWSQIGVSDGIRVDDVVPSTPVVSDDGPYTTDRTQLHARWWSSALSGIAEYQYAIGTTAGATDVVGWTSAGVATDVTKTGLALKDGTTCFFSVKARNNAGTWSAVGASDGILVDGSPPTTPVVSDDGQWAASLTTLHATWTASEDPHTGVVEYQYAIGTTAGGAQVVGWTSLGMATEVTKTGLALTHGTTYYVNVKAKNKVGLWSLVGSSDGITVDPTPPTTPVVTDDGATTGSATQLHATWTASSDPESGIVDYQYQIRQDATAGTMIRDWTSIGTTTQVTATGLGLINGKAYYIGVRAKNGVGLFSATAFSDGISVGSDTTPPTGTVTINSGAAYTGSTSATLTLSAADNSGTVSQMQFSNDGTTYSTPEAYATSKGWTLTPGDGSKTVYAKFQDTAGNWSSPATDAIVVDTTAPTTPTVSDDGAYTSSTTQLHASWTASSDTGSGIVDYQYQIWQDSPGGTLIRDWTSVGLATEVTATGLSITSGRTYYLGVRATDGAGLSSNTGLSNGITVDTTPPTGTVTINSGAASTKNFTVTLTLSASDNTGAIPQMQFSNDNVTYSTPEAYAATKTWTLVAGDGTKTVYAKFQDAAGNWSAATSDTILLDTTPPITTAHPAGGTFTGITSVSLTANEPATIYYTTDGTTPTTSSKVYTTSISISGTTTLMFFAVDTLGNAESVKTELYQIQPSTGPTDVSGTIGANTTWTPSGNPYRVIGSVTVASGVTLTLQAGVVVQFQGSDFLTVQGTLQANGTAAQPVQLLSGKATPAPGDWRGLYFTGAGGGTLTQVQIQHAYYGMRLDGTGTVMLKDSVVSQCSICVYLNYVATGGLTVTGSRLGGTGSGTTVYLYQTNPAVISVTNSQLLPGPSGQIVSTDYYSGSPYAGQTANFTNNWWGTADPVAIQQNIYDYTDGAASAPLIDFTPFLDGPNGTPVPGNFVWGPLLSSATWTAAQNPSLIIGDVTVPAGMTLTLDAGVTVKALGNFTLTVQGTLQANGTAAQPVQLLSGKATPAPGDWRGLYFTGAGGGTLTQVQIQHAYYGMLLEGTGTVTLQASAINQSTSALYVNSPTAGLTVTGSRLEGTGGNYTAYLYQFNPTRLSITNSQLLPGPNASQTVYAIYASTGMAGQTANFTNNWWGTADPVAIQQKIYDYADGATSAPRIKYEPFLDGPSGTPRIGIYVKNAPVGSIIALQETFALDLYSLEPSNWKAAFRNSQGQIVRTITADNTATFLVSWNGTRDDGTTAVPSGLYTCAVTAVHAVSGVTSFPHTRSVYVSSQGEPAAQIDSPLADQMVNGDALTITGTAAAGGQFDHYDLYWGVGSAPASWNYISSSTTSVAQGTLATWYIASMSQGLVTLRLRVYNKALQVATAQVTFKILNIYGANLTNTFISPNGDGVQDTTTLAASVTQAVNWTVEIKPTLADPAVKSFSGTGAAISVGWDGKDAAGNPAPEGLYAVDIRVTEPVTSLTDRDSSRSLTVDRTGPEARITSPPENQTFLIPDPITFTGTADDANFSRYSLDYGTGSSPGSWTNLITAYGRVVNGTLYTLDFQRLPPDTYTFRLTVNDRAGNTTVVNRHVTLDYIPITNISASPTFSDPYGGERASINYTTGRPADITIRIYDDLTKQLVRTFIQSVTQAGAQSVLWDGKNAAGSIAPLEAYYFTIVATDSNGRRGTYNDATTPLRGPTPYYSANVSAAGFDPYRNDLAPVTYTMSALGRAFIRILNANVYSGTPIRGLVNQEIRAAGSQTEPWGKSLAP